MNYNSINTNPEKIISENFLIFILAAVQFINVLDFMMVMPMGPDFALALNIPTSHIGWIGGIYALMSAISGFICALFIDNYDRKKVLSIALLGLMSATALCALSWDFHSMMFFRGLAGSFGGPLFSIIIAIVSDNIKPEKRGIALAKVMASFSIASVFGIPFGLEVARHFGWQAPFLFLSGFGFLILAFAHLRMPAQNKAIVKLSVGERYKILISNFYKPIYVGTFAFMGLGIMSGSMIIPNISAHLQFGLGYPRDSLWLLYFVGGIFSLLAIGIGGRIVDKVSASFVALVSNIIIVAALLLGFVFYSQTMAAFSPNLKLPVVIFFVMFMLGMSTRNLAGQTLASKIPAAHERAGFSSVQHSVINICQALGAFIASKILVQGESFKLINIEYVALSSIFISILAFLFLYLIEKLYKKSAINE
jgi:predicted MFS family arabinose efflux permease